MVDLRNSGLTEGEGDADGGTGLLPVNQADRATVALNQLSGDGEAQTGTAALTGAGLVHPVETVEDALPVLFGDLVKD